MQFNRKKPVKPVSDEDSTFNQEFDFYKWLTIKGKISVFHQETNNTKIKARELVNIHINDLDKKNKTNQIKLVKKRPIN